MIRAGLLQVIAGQGNAAVEPLTESVYGPFETARDGYGTGSFTTASFTPPANSLLVAVVHVFGQDVATHMSGDLTITDSAGRTWTSRALASDPQSYSTLLGVFTAPAGASPGLNTITVDCGSNNVFMYRVNVVAYTNYNVADPIGAVLAYTTPSRDLDGPITITLPSAPSATSYVLAALLNDGLNTNASAITGGTGWTELINVDTDALYYDSSQMQSRTGSTSTSVTWNDVGSAGYVYKLVAAAIEIKAA